ncbi:MAG TPA: glycerol kinase GlpK [Streptosporangiaceae bacterium]|nr:glycerol kinase GlpK [Streptosporangiaceae bacterium]
MSVLAIDAGTTGVTALIVTADGAIASRGYAEFSQYFPEPGWVEQLPDEIWQATLAACGQALDGAPGRSGRSAGGGGIDPIQCVGITNQRETAVIWDSATLAAPRRAIVWQDRRTARICAELRDAGHEERVAELTGLRIDPYFTATKLTWMARHDDAVWAGVRDGSLAVGTVDSYLIARLTGGRRHVTDASNASRTLLFDIAAGQWSAELCELFGVPPRALPEVTASTGEIGVTDPREFLGLSVPIAGVAGDQQAALFGQACYAPGSAKCTYGTGSFVLTNTGSQIVRSGAGLLSTVAWMDDTGALTYALEGAVFVTGAAIQWLRDGLGIIDQAADSEALARSVDDSGGVVFVPALTGLGAPDWDPDARGAIFGLTRGTTRAHLARATLEAIAFEVRDVMDLMTAEAAAVGAASAGAAGVSATGAGSGGVSAAGAGADGAYAPLRVDGGAAANDLLMQIQADQLQLPVERPMFAETTGLGAAFLAGLATGVWSSTDELAATWRLDRRFDPGATNDAAHRRWREAVSRSLGWASHADRSAPT